MAEDKVSLAILVNNENIPPEIFSSSVDKYFGPQMEDFNKSSLVLCILSNTTGLEPSQDNVATYIKSQWLFMTTFKENEIFQFKVVICDNRNWNIIAYENEIETRELKTFQIDCDKTFLTRINWNIPLTFSIESLTELYSMDESFIKSYYESHEISGYDVSHHEFVDPMQNLHTIKEDVDDTDSLVDSLQGPIKDGEKYYLSGSEDSLQDKIVENENNEISLYDDSLKNSQINEMDDIDNAKLNSECIEGNEKKNNQKSKTDAELIKERKEIRLLKIQSIMGVKSELQSIKLIDFENMKKEKEKSLTKCEEEIESEITIKQEDEESCLISSMVMENLSYDNASSFEADSTQKCDGSIYTEPLSIAFIHEPIISLSDHKETSLESKIELSKELEEKELCVSEGIKDCENPDEDSHETIQEMIQYLSNVEEADCLNDQDGRNEIETNLNCIKKDNITVKIMGENFEIEKNEEKEVNESKNEEVNENENEEKEITIIDDQNYYLEDIKDNKNVKKLNTDNIQDEKIFLSNDIHTDEIKDSIIREENKNEEIINKCIKKEESYRIEPLEEYKNQEELNIINTEEEKYQFDLDVKDLEKNNSEISDENKKEIINANITPLDHCDIDDPDNINFNQNNSVVLKPNVSDNYDIAHENVLNVGLISDEENIGEHLNENEDQNEKDIDLCHNKYIEIEENICVRKQKELSKVDNTISENEQIMSLYESQHILPNSEEESNIIGEKNILSIKAEDNINISLNIKADLNEEENVNQSEMKESQELQSPLKITTSNTSIDNICPQVCDFTFEGNEIQFENLEELKNNDSKNDYFSKINCQTPLESDSDQQKNDERIIKDVDQILEGNDNPEMEESIITTQPKVETVVEMFERLGSNEEEPQRLSKSYKIENVDFNLLKQRFEGDHIEIEDKSVLKSSNIEVKENEKYIESINIILNKKPCESKKEYKDGEPTNNDDKNNNKLNGENPKDINEKVNINLKINTDIPIVTKPKNENKENETFINVTDKVPDKKMSLTSIEHKLDIKEINDISSHLTVKEIKKILNEKREKLAVNDDYKYPDSVTPTKVEHNLLQSPEYNVPFMDDESFYKENWYEESDDRWASLERENLETKEEQKLTPVTETSIKMSPKACTETFREPEDNKPKISDGSVTKIPKKRGLISLCGCVGGK